MSIHSILTLHGKNWKHKPKMTMIDLFRNHSIGICERSKFPSGIGD